MLLIAVLAFSIVFAGTARNQAQETAQPEAKVAGNVNLAAAANEHPLMPVIRWAEKERPRLEAIKDYTALMTKQENINGVIQEAEVMEIKVRHQPLSFYLKFGYPKNKAGQEAIWIKGQNDGKLIGHGTGFERKFGTQFVDPNGFIAMRGCKYPITEMGILNLVDKLLDVGYKDSKFGECEVKYYQGVKVGDRECTLIRVVHPIPRRNFIFHIAQIFVDNELNLPIRYESYDWPKKEGEPPILIEAYTYENLKVNVGLTDADFDYRNPAYSFP